MAAPLEADVPEEFLKEGDEPECEHCLDTGLVDDPVGPGDTPKSSPCTHCEEGLVKQAENDERMAKVFPNLSAKARVEATRKDMVEEAPKKNPRKMRSGSKGTAIELKAKKHLEDEGWVVHRCVRTGVKRGPFYMSQSNDVFGCVDLVAKKRGEPTLWIQVTADSGIGRKKDDLLKIPWSPGVDDVRIWKWVGGSHTSHKVTGKPIIKQFFDQYFLTMVNKEEMAYDGPTVRDLKLDFVKDENRRIYLGAKKPKDSFAGSLVR